MRLKILYHLHKGCQRSFQNPLSLSTVFRTLCNSGSPSPIIQDPTSHSRTLAQPPPYNTGKWKPYEDFMLLEAIKKYRNEATGAILWSEVKTMMEGSRSLSQCAARWSRLAKRGKDHDSSSTAEPICHTRRDAQLPHNIGKWKPYEDNMLLEAIKEHREEVTGAILWSEVKTIMEGTRSYAQCVDRWSKHLRIRPDSSSSSSSSTFVRPDSEPSEGDEQQNDDDSKRFWLKTEDALLIRLVPMHQYLTKDGKVRENWNAIVKQFQGSRSYLQCYLRWKTVLMPRTMYKQGAWSADEDDILLGAYASDPASSIENVDWLAVSRILGNTRSPRQCRVRVISFYDRKTFSTGRWSAEEDRVLKAGIQKYIKDGGGGEDVKISWAKLSKNLSLSRSSSQCHARARYYASLKNTEPWSEAEDSLLRTLVEKYKTVGSNGGINWEFVGRRISNRGSFQCRIRWFEHVKLGGLRRRGPFSPFEDTHLMMAVSEVRKNIKKLHPTHFWISVGETFGPTRSHTQCRERWKCLTCASSASEATAPVDDEEEGEEKEEGGGDEDEEEEDEDEEKEDEDEDDMRDSDDNDNDNDKEEKEDDDKEDGKSDLK